MITITVHCPHCWGEELVRNNRTLNGKQKYCCRACKRQSREHSTPHAYPEERREEILRSYEERSSLRGLERTFGVSRTSVIGWIKKAEKLPALSETVIAPDANDADATVLELDELWSFVIKKTNQAWIWIALCRKTRQSLHLPWEIAEKSHANTYGKPFHQPIVQDTASQIFGWSTRL